MYQDMLVYENTWTIMILYLMRIIIYNPKKVSYCQKKKNSSIPNTIRMNEQMLLKYHMSVNLQSNKILEYYISKSTTSV